MHVVLVVLIIFYIGPDKAEHVALGNVAAPDEATCEQAGPIIASQLMQKPGVVYVASGCIEATDKKDKTA